MQGSWNRRQTLLLIKEFQKHPCLYNPMDINYKKRKYRNKKFIIIWNEMKKYKKYVTRQCVLQKLRSLRRQLIKEEVKLKNSFYDGVYIYQPILWCYNELSFLKNANNEDGQTAVSSSSDIDLSNDSEDNSSQQLQNQTLVVHDYAKQLVQHPLIEGPHANIELFCRDLLSELELIKLDDTFEDLKLEILELVTKRIKEERQMLQEEIFFQPISIKYEQELIYTDPIIYTDPLSLSFPSTNSYSVS